MDTKKWLEYYTAHPQDFDNMINLTEGTILEQASKLATLTAHNESMQADAVNNTATIKMLMAEIERLTEKVRYAYVQIEALEKK